MLRITTVEDESGTTKLIVEGRLTEESMEGLETTCARHVAGGRTPSIDVAGLTYSDRAGGMALRRVRDEGMPVVGASSFLEELMRPEPATPRPTPPVRPPRAGAAADQDEASLLAGLRAGDAGAFEVLIRRYGARMLATARRIVRSDDDAQDVVQEAYVSAWKCIASFSGEARLSTWLHRVVVNAALMRLRARARRPEASIDDLLPRFAEDGHFAESPAPWSSGVEDLVGVAETRKAVRACIDRLPESHRTVILLRDIEGLDTEETATALGVSTNAVKVRLHRARQALKTLIEAAGLTR
jgi:RNA polymerase sigma-70 factor (ECF subfamily)